MATTTPQFGWAVPTSTDYVKDGAAAIETLGDAIDARFGDVATYPNQIVNVVSGVSRPVPYATNAGSATITGNGTITFAASRFTQTPLVNVNVQTTANTATSVTYAGASSASMTVYVWSGSTASTTARTVNYFAVQMTSAAAAG
jgi:hypothetical protein